MQKQKRDCVELFQGRAINIVALRRYYKFELLFITYAMYA